MFKIGDLAVYPAQGVGVIEAIEAKNVGGGGQQDFYILRIVDSNMTIMIPVSNAGLVGMRNLIAKERIASVYGILEEKRVNGAVASWSRRQREYNEKIRSGNLFEVAEVLRELYQIREDKELSYGEKKVLELARKLLIKEIALAEGSEEDDIAQRVEKIFLH